MWIPSPAVTGDGDPRGAAAGADLLLLRSDHSPCLAFPEASSLLLPPLSRPVGDLGSHN